MVNALKSSRRRAAKVPAQELESPQTEANIAEAVANAEAAAELEAAVVAEATDSDAAAAFHDSKESVTEETPEGETTAETPEGETPEIKVIAYAFEMENPSKGRAVNNSEGVSKSWQNPETRAKRTARHSVRVTTPAGETTEYKSVWKAFQALYAKPSETRAIKFRGELVAAKRLQDMGGNLWEITN